MITAALPVRAGMARARENGTKSGNAIGRHVKSGNAIGRPRIDGKVEDEIRGLLGSGKGICSTAVAAGVGVATVQRIKSGDAGLKTGEALGECAHIFTRLGASLLWE